MADKGIIFSAPMVQALLAGRKTQTRRLLKIENDRIPSDATAEQPYPEDHPHIWAILSRGIGCDEYERATPFSLRPHAVEYWRSASLPYAPGDRLYVREAWSHTGQGVWDIAAARMVGRSGVIYSADGKVPGAKYWPSIHLPREFSRLWLNVTDVRVQRLQEISEADARAEGIAEYPCEGPHRGLDATYWSAERGHPEHGARTTPVSAFGALWNSLHTKPGETWEDNPWIVAVSFGVNHGNIGQAASVTAGAGAAIDG